MNHLLDRLDKRGRALVLPLLALGTLLLLLMPQGSLQAQTRNQAGLVIVHGDGRVTTRCVTFEEGSISGLALLQRSGLSLDASSGAGGVKVCRIEGEGCPASDCFCQCKGSPCVYWNYFYRSQGGAWAYSPLGAAGRTVQPGDVDGWVWGDGSSPPPDVDLTAICTVDEPVTQPATSTPTVPIPTTTPTPEPAALEPEPAPPTPEATSTPKPTTSTTEPAATTTEPAALTATATATETATATPTTQPATMTPTSTGTPVPDPSPTLSPSPAPERVANGQPSTLSYAIFVALVVALGGAFWFVRHRGG